MKKPNKKQILLYSLLAVFFVGYGIPTFLNDGDFPTLLFGSERLISRSTITLSGKYWFTYPPFFAFIMIPLAIIPFPAAKLIWYLINWACLISCIFMIKHLVFQTNGFGLIPSQKKNWILLGGCFITVKYILSVFENQQFDLLVFFFCLSGLFCIFRKKEILGSSLVAAGISIKCTPLLFLPYFAVKRKWKVVCATTTFTVVFSLLPDILFFNGRFSYFFDWFSKIVFYHPLLAKLGEPGFDGGSLAPGFGVNYLNQSLGVLVYRMFSEEAIQCVNNIAQLDDETVRIVKFVIFGAVVLLPLVILRKRVFSRFSEAGFPSLLESAGVFVLMVLLSPMSSKAHFNTLLYGNTLLVAVYVIRKDKAILWGILLPIGLLQLTARGIIGHDNADYCYQFGVTTIGALLTYTGLIWSYKKYWYFAKPKRAQIQSVNGKPTLIVRA
jgi:hypothetical protein